MPVLEARHNTTGGKAMKIGDRVEIPVWSDLWMRGDRYGEVIAIKVRDHRDENIGARVRLDKSGTAPWFSIEDLKPV
jgi:hypothetical protein